jgi:hypothetical protein
MVDMRLLARCSAGNRPVSSGRRNRPEIKHTYDLDKKIYRKKVQTAIFARQDKDITLQVMQDLIDMTQYFKDEGVLYDVLTEMEDDLFFYEVCTWYRKIRG